MITERIEIAGFAGGPSHAVAVHRFGRADAGPAVYIQAALHADEIPGMLCAVALRAMLAKREAAGDIRGSIVLVPVANPIGLGQQVLGQAVGRFDLADGGNFNRDFPTLCTELVAQVGPRLGEDGAANAALVRRTFVGLIEAQSAHGAAARLKKALLTLAAPCDLVLDLHCDAEATVHLYTHPRSEATFAPLAARLGCEAFLLAPNSGGEPFDEALSRPWFELAEAFPGRPIPQCCCSATVELRGQADVDEDLARSDAAAIVAFLQDVGVIAGEPPAAPSARCPATPLAASEPLEAPVGGILLYRRPVGATVRLGETVAEIVDPLTGAATRVASPCDGVLFARIRDRFVVPGRRLGKVAGALARRTGHLLSP